MTSAQSALADAKANGSAHAQEALDDAKKKVDDAQAEVEAAKSTATGSAADALDAWRPSSPRSATSSSAQAPTARAAGRTPGTPGRCARRRRGPRRRPGVGLPCSRGFGALRRGELAARRRGTLYETLRVPILEVWQIVRRTASLRRHHVEWWIVTAWASLGLVVAAGFTAAAGLVS